MREPFALCRKAFATPLGPVAADEAAIDALASAADGFDPYADQFNHKREHSLEFQAVFLKHLLGGRELRIVPVLAGLGIHQASGEDPEGDARVVRFLDGVRSLVESRPGRVVVVAGADMAHVGPRFGDEHAYDDPKRRQLEAVDRAPAARRSNRRESAADARCHGSKDLSLGSSGARGRVLHYEQSVDEDDGSIVSHAAVGFYA